MYLPYRLVLGMTIKYTNKIREELHWVVYPTVRYCCSVANVCMCMFALSPGEGGGTWCQTGYPCEKTVIKIR
jgi:hypothetical protein